MVKIGIMLSHARKEAREVYKTLQWNAEGDNQKFDKRLEDTVRHAKILYERYTFWTLQQEVDESVDTYLTRIKLKLEMCEHAAEVCQDLACDKFVFGLIDGCLKERLLHEGNLKLAAVGQEQ